MSSVAATSEVASSQPESLAAPPDLKDLKIQALLDNVASLRHDKKYSDLIIDCEGHTWQVHKAIVCPQSAVIASQIDKTWKESVSGVIKHEEIDAASMDCMVQWLYTQDYDYAASRAAYPGTTKTESESNDLPESTLELIAHVKVAALADYYAVQLLHEAATEKFQACLSKELVADTFMLVLNTVQEHLEKTSALYKCAVQTVASNGAHLSRCTRFQDTLISGQNHDLFTEVFACQASLLEDSKAYRLMLSTESNLELLRINKEEYETMQKKLCMILNARNVPCSRCRRSFWSANPEQDDEGWQSIANGPDSLIICLGCQGW